MSRKKVATTIYITNEQDKHLKLLSQAMGIPMAELIRQGIDHVLERYRDRLPAQLGLFPDADAKPEEVDGASATSAATPTRRS